MSGVKPVEADDPFALIGFAYPAGPGLDADRVLATCLAEEFALAGLSAVEVARLFESAQYTVPNAILHRRGPEFVRTVITGVYGARP